MVKRHSHLRWAMAFFCAIALLLSAILCIHTLSGHGLIGCSAGTNCNQVLGSRWSLIIGIIPVSGLAFCVYLILAFCLFFADKINDDPSFSRLLWLISTILSGAITGSAIWFIWLQQNFIKAFCPYCMSAHISGLLLSIFLLIYLIRSRKLGSIGKIVLFFAVGIMLAAGLASFQLLTTPRTAYERGFVTEELPKVNPNDLPIEGSPKAEKIITLLFDYQCSHCQKIHAMLPQVVEHFEGKVAFVLCPTPLSMKCNPHIHASEDRFVGSCDLAKIGLAIWRSDKTAFKRFDTWWFEAQDSKVWHMHTLAEARLMAEELIGADNLAQKMNDSWTQDYLSLILELFGRTLINGKAAIPRLIYGTNWLVPDADNAAGLEELIENLCFPEVD